MQVLTWYLLQRPSSRGNSLEYSVIKGLTVFIIQQRPCSISKREKKKFEG